MKLLGLFAVLVVHAAATTITFVAKYAISGREDPLTAVRAGDLPFNQARRVHRDMERWSHERYTTVWDWRSHGLKVVAGEVAQSRADAVRELDQMQNLVRERVTADGRRRQLMVEDVRV